MMGGEFSDDEFFEAIFAIVVTIACGIVLFLWVGSILRRLSWFLVIAFFVILSVTGILVLAAYYFDDVRFKTLTHIPLENPTWTTNGVASTLLIPIIRWARLSWAWATAQMRKLALKLLRDHLEA